MHSQSQFDTHLVPRVLAQVRCLQCMYIDISA